MSIDRLALGVTGGAFLLRALSGQLPAYARVGYLLVGINLVNSARAVSSAPMPASPFGELAPGGGSTPTTLKFEPRKARTLSERVSYIHEQAIKGVKEDSKAYVLARQIVTRKCGNDWCIPERDHMGEVSALFWEVRRRVRYTLDPVIFDAFQTPDKTLELKAGDCDDATGLLAAMLISIGLPVSSRVVHTRGWDTWNHIYLVVTLPYDVDLPDGTRSRQVPLDPIFSQPPGWQVPKSHIIQMRDFPIVKGA